MRSKFRRNYCKKNQLKNCYNKKQIWNGKNKRKNKLLKKEN